MAKKTEGAADRLATLVAEIEAAAYARGKTDARTELLAVLGASEKSAPAPRRNKRSEARPTRKRRSGGGKRAPRGSVRALIERALSDRSGLTAQEILDCADTDAERMVKLPSLWAELTEGRRQGRYESVDGRWSLAAPPSSDGEGARHMPASPEPDGTTGVSSDATPSEAGASAATGTVAGDTPGESAASPEPETGGEQNRLGMNW